MVIVKQDLYRGVNSVMEQKLRVFTDVYCGLLSDDYKQKLM